MSNAGIVPPSPGWSATLSTIYYSGDFGRDGRVPLVGEIGVDLDMDVSYTLALLTYVWPLQIGGWNFASQLGVPVQYSKLGLDLSVSGTAARQTDSSTDFADVIVTPIVAGYHFSRTDHVSLALAIYAPTAGYDRSRLSNAGQNVWTFVPTVSYTRLDGRGGEITGMAALEFYTRNGDTDYKSGLNSRLDLMWTRSIAPGWAAGLLGGVIYQLRDDEGRIADALGGFKGRSVGLGPIVNWSGKLGNVPGSFSLRWVHELDTRNRPEGRGFGLSLSLMFL